MHAKQNRQRWCETTYVLGLTIPFTQGARTLGWRTTVDAAGMACRGDRDTRYVRETGDNHQMLRLGVDKLTWRKRRELLQHACALQRLVQLCQVQVFHQTIACWKGTGTSHQLTPDQLPGPKSCSHRAG